MAIPNTWKVQFFDAALKHVKEHSATLQRFCSRFPKNAGFEFWLKIELAAELPEKIIGTVSSAGRTAGRSPDVKIIPPRQNPIQIEFKASCDWSPHHMKGWSHYYGRLLVFLCVGNCSDFEWHWEELITQDTDAKLQEVCSAGPSKRGG
jgi:hypothetical protein